MNWRALLGVFAGLLLPVPLVLLLASALLPAPRRPGSAEARISPMLDVEEATRRVTYHRNCHKNSECEPPLACFYDVRIGIAYCTDSRCSNHEQCAQDEECRALPTEKDGPLVRLCVPLGMRKEGEHCFSLPSDKAAACEPGLQCGGEHGWCARTCRQGDAAGCPEGFFCADVEPEPLCLPSCEARGCPEGLQCVHFTEGTSACMRVYGDDCLRSACPENLKCELSVEARRPGKAWAECERRCGEKYPPCPTGTICDGWSCTPPCEPNGPNTCAEGYRCQQFRPNKAGQPWVCLPDR